MRKGNGQFSESGMFDVARTIIYKFTGNKLRRFANQSIIAHCTWPVAHCPFFPVFPGVPQTNTAETGNCTNLSPSHVF